MNRNSKQTVSREEYRRLDNWVTSILQQHWPANLTSTDMHNPLYKSSQYQMVAGNRQIKARP
ncbi:hypothetical protein Q7C15_17455 [Aeromonas salmonicida]|uniref:hypothetical protein n=1 Tax=Aeromonas salmonicida TaxID=645 RepID=UPI0035C2129A